jgi:signal transduction histidine kinase
MSRATESALTDPQQVIAQLQQQLDERTAERDALRRELADAREQQTATGEVLQVINSSPGELTPVFDSMLEKALRLCEAAFGMLWTYDGDRFRMAAHRGLSAELEDALRRSAGGWFVGLSEQPMVQARPGEGSGLRRILDGEAFWQLDDTAAEPLQSGIGLRTALVQLGGIRTQLLVALRKDNVLLGVFHIYRREVRPFSNKQIALLQNFAAQAVIAMENARLITETREALAQQTATAEVLQVINSSPGDLAPVFGVMLEKATRLCDASFGVLWQLEGERFIATASHDVPAAFADFTRSPIDLDKGAALTDVARGAAFVHVADLADSEAYRAGNPLRRAIVELGGARSLLTVPLRKEGELLGAFVVYRQEVQPFADQQIALVQSFAAQAVIAMENARLISETREALEQQQAIAEILQVINRSPGDLQPVFETILEKAHSLCGVTYGALQLYDGEKLRAIAVHGFPPAWGDRLRAGYVPGPNMPTRRLIEGEPVAHTPDLATEDDPHARSAGEIGGVRTCLWVALRKDDVLLGAIAAARLEVRSFSEKEIALLENFAAQAVIAMDNARLLGEIRQRQAELRVTFDNMGDGVAMFDADLKLAAWNHNFQQILDLRDEFVSTHPSYAEYLRYNAERGEFGEVDIEAEVARRLQAIDQDLRFEHTRPDGRIIEVRRNPMPGGGAVLIYSDVTERKRAEEAIRAARDAAEQALKELQTTQASLVHAQKMAALGQLTAGIAHEIKNPLNFVNNFAGLSIELLDELKAAAAPAIATLDEDTRAEIDETVGMLTSNLEKIADHGNRADGIVKSMLEHSRGGSDDRRSLDLNALIDEALNLAYHGARAQDQTFNIALERDFASSMAPIELVPQDMTRVFLNLFGNGFYAANQRRKRTAGNDFLPTLKVATRDVDGMVEVRVRDNGTGIAPEIREKLFQPFVTTKPTGEGTGLGLSISYEIVTQQHGGTIAVDSAPGEFTEFTIRLPRSRGRARSGSAA